MQKGKTRANHARPRSGQTQDSARHHHPHHQHSGQTSSYAVLVVQNAVDDVKAISVVVLVDAVVEQG